MVEESSKREKLVFKYWNKTIGVVTPFKLGQKNMALSSAKKIMMGDPHRAHSQMLKHGLDSFTLKLFLSESSSSTSHDIAKLVKIMVYAYRLAEANERAVESTFFTFLVANNDFSILKDIFVISVLVGALLIGLHVN